MGPTSSSCSPSRSSQLIHVAALDISKVDKPVLTGVYLYLTDTASKREWWERGRRGAWQCCSSCIHS